MPFKTATALHCRNIVLLLTFMMFGSTIAYFQDARHDNNWYGRGLDKVAALKIELQNTPVKKAKTTLLNVAITSISINGKWQNSKGFASIYVYNKNLHTTFKEGQSYIIPNDLIPIKSSGNPFSFDQKAFANRKGLYHQCFIAPEKLIAVASKSVLSGFSKKLSNSIQHAIENNIKDSSTKALMEAMIMNERSGIQSGLNDAYSQTGIIHIISISGMHVLLLASIILFLISRIPIKKIQGSKYAFALILVWIYISITGFPPSAVRAAVMFSIFAVGKIMNREGKTINTWATAGFLLLCYNPYWLYDVGFQLSFLAVLSILLFNKSVSNWWQPDNKILRYFWDGIAVSISVQILVFPLVIYYFHQFPILVFIANIPAAVFSTFLMCSAIVIYILSSAGIPCLWLGTLTCSITKGFNSFIYKLSSLSPESFRSFYLDKYDYWILMFAIVFLCSFLYFKNNKHLIIGLSTAILLLVSFIWKDWNALHAERLVVYNLSNKSMIDYFKGNTVHHLDTFNLQDEKYALRAARLGFGACNEIQDIDNKDIVIINKMKILKLKRGSITGENPFPVDVLIVNKDCEFTPEKWYAIFHPRQIVIDGSLPRWKAIQWKETLRNAGANVQWVQDDRAWIYPEL